MLRREFLGLVAAGLTAVSLLGVVLRSRHRPRVLVAPLGDRARALAEKTMSRMSGVMVMPPDDVRETLMAWANSHDPVILMGCLGGKNGLEDALMYAECAEPVAIPIQGVVLWPMHFEGRRREAAASQALAKLMSVGAHVEIVQAPLREGLTLAAAQARRESALIGACQDLIHALSRGT